MSSKRPKGQPVSTSPRLLWGANGGRLWSGEGQEFRFERGGLSRGEVSSILRGKQTDIAIVDVPPVRWVSAADALDAWVTEISKDFEDVEDWKAPSWAPGQLPYRAELWHAVNSPAQVLVFLSD